MTMTTSVFMAHIIGQSVEPFPTGVQAGVCWPEVVHEQEMLRLFSGWDLKALSELGH